MHRFECTSVALLSEHQHQQQQQLCLPCFPLNRSCPWPPLCHCRAEKAAWQKTQKALEAHAERGKRATEEARARLAEQENAIKAIGMERHASQQERCVATSRGALLAGKGCGHALWMPFSLAGSPSPVAVHELPVLPSNFNSSKCFTCSHRRQAEADVKAREAKLAAALEEAQRLRRALEEARGAAAARTGVSREEHARVVAENRQLVAQVCRGGARPGWQV